MSMTKTRIKQRTIKRQEELARKLITELTVYLQSEYDHGRDDGRKIIQEQKEEIPMPKRIERIYLENGHIMVASCCRAITSVQRGALDNKLLLIDQINAMIEDAEDRGRKEGSSHTSI